MHPGFRSCFRRLFGSLFVLVMLVTGVEAEDRAPSPEGPRLALVVGVSRYAAGPLATADNDAGLVARALSQAGFTVTAAADADRARVDAVVQAFLATLTASGPGATVVVYVAGYGLQYADDIYLAPLGATLARDVDVPTEAVSLSALAQAIEALPAKARLFIYDIAHEHPFAQAGPRLASGLPWIAPGPGTLVAINAAPGTVATPDVMPYGAYARALAEAIGTPGLPIALLLEHARLRVGMLTNGATIPWNAGTLPAAITFRPGTMPPLAVPAPTAAVGVEGGTSGEAAYVAAIAQDTIEAYLAFLKAYPAEPLAIRMRTIVAARREALIWNESRRADSDRAYWTYQRRYPRGPHFADARRRLMLLHAALEPPLRFDIFIYSDVPPPPPTEMALIDRAFVTLDDTAWPAVPPLGGTLPPSSPAFHQALPPPPLVTAGLLPIAVPIPGVMRETGVITQPGPAVVSETRFAAGGDAVVTTLAAGKPIERTATTTLPNGNCTIVQEEADGTVISRTTMDHDRETTTIVQTGPSGGILSRSVTRADAGGGRMTVETNGRNQIVATLTVDPHGMTTTTHGFVSVSDQMFTLAPIRAAERPVLLPPLPPPSASRPTDMTAHQAVLPPAEPPPPLVMPMSALPPPVASPAPAISSSRLPEQKGPSRDKPEVKTPQVETLEAKTPEARTPEVKTPDAELPASGGSLPVVAPMPPRREAASGLRPVPKAGAPARGRVAPATHSKRSPAAAPRRRR